jgi:hypothetical protein
MSTLIPATVDDLAFTEQLEPIACKIELLETAATTAILQIASEAAKIHDSFRYRRNEGGYAGYMKKRLGYSSSSAYRLLDVHARFGGSRANAPAKGVLGNSRCGWQRSASGATSQAESAAARRCQEAPPSGPGSFAMLAAMRHASSRVCSLAAERRPGPSGRWPCDDLWKKRFRN